MENKYLINVKKVDGSVVSFESRKEASTILEILNSGNEFVLLGNQLERVKSIENVTVEELRQPEESENTEISNLEGKRVHVTRLDGNPVDLYATLKLHVYGSVNSNTYYALLDCSNPYYEGYGVYSENTDKFGDEDCYTVVDDEFVGRRVHVKMLDGSPVDFYATLEQKEESERVYILRNCSNPNYENFRVFKKESYGYRDCDEYTFVE